MLIVINQNNTELYKSKTRSHPWVTVDIWYVSLQLFFLPCMCVLVCVIWKLLKNRVIYKAIWFCQLTGQQ